MRIAVWPASLGIVSSNRAALEVAAKWLAKSGAQVTWVPGVDQMPAFRPEQADHPPPLVASVRSMIESADALLIAAPEYAGGMAGTAKNALDWLVGAGSVYHKLAGVLSSGTTGGEYAREQMVRTLSWQGALTVASLGIEQPRAKMDNDEFSDPATISAIEAWAAEVVMANRLSHDERVVKTTAIVAPFGINPARFGPAAD